MPVKILAQFSPERSIPTEDISTQKPGGVRVILPEEVANTTVEPAAKQSNSKSVLFGLAAIFLIIIAALAALFLYSQQKRNGTINNPKNDS